MKESYNFLKKCKTYYLATIEDDHPRVRPFGTIDIFNNKLTILSIRNKNVSKQIETIPKIEICAYDGETWVRIEATAYEETSIEAKNHMLNEYPHLKEKFSENKDKMQIFSLNNVTTTFNLPNNKTNITKF